MTISVRCKNPDCGKPCRVKDEYAGKSVKCPGCGQRIPVPSREPALALDEPGEVSAPRAERSVPRKEEPDRFARRAVWPWLVGMAVMLLVGVLVGAGSGYFLASSQAKKSVDGPGQSGDDSELRKVRAELQVATAEAAAAKAELARVGGVAAVPPTAKKDTAPAAKGPPTGTSATDANKTDAFLKSMQGSWVIETAQLGFPTVPSAKGHPLTITGTKYTRKLPVNNGVESGTFALVAGTDPMRIDLKMEDGYMLEGIIKVEGDKLTLCYEAVRLGQNKYRPFEFKTGTSTPGVMLIVYKRAQ